MKTAKLFTGFALGAGLCLTPLATHAQSSTGASVATDVSGNPIDLNWFASRDAVAFFQAFVLASRPSDDPSTHRWIDVSPTGSVPGGSGDGFLTRFPYYYETTFSGSGLSTLSFQCAVDDAFTSISLNGHLTGASCAQYSFGATQTISGFVDGPNTLLVATAGNGITDGFILKVTDKTFAVTGAPEPASLVLTATGLGMIGGGVRRRRRTR